MYITRQTVSVLYSHWLWCWNRIYWQVVKDWSVYCWYSRDGLNVIHRPNRIYRFRTHSSLRSTNYMIRDYCRSMRRS